MTKTIKVTNLVSDQANMARYTDPLLLNAWGNVFQDYTMWVAANHSGVVQGYNKHGVLKYSVTVEPIETQVTADPTGIALNQSTGFVVRGSASDWMVCTESGTIVAYSPLVNATNAYIVVDNSDAGAIYKGIASHDRYIYVCNFHSGKVETYDFDYTSVNFPFVDGDIVTPLPANYVPFNIVVHKEQLYVMYANKAHPDDGDETPGAGFGYISIFDFNGVFVRRFVSNGQLNAPWGLATAPKDFTGEKYDVLVGNFGDGNINVYSPTGEFKGKLMNKHHEPVIIDGLWGLVRRKDIIYFAAGPNDEEHGLVGSLYPRDH